jgi:hypothetical protein
MGGMNVAEATAYGQYLAESNPKFDTSTLPPYRELPMQALDHAAGYFLAYGIAVALCKTITVRQSLSFHSMLDSFDFCCFFSTYEHDLTFAQISCRQYNITDTHRKVVHGKSTSPSALSSTGSVP